MSIEANRPTAITVAGGSGMERNRQEQTLRFLFILTCHDIWLAGLVKTRAAGQLDMCGSLKGKRNLAGRIIGVEGKL